MKQLNSNELLIVNGGVVHLIGYYLYMASSISSMYSLAKIAGKR